MPNYIKSTSFIVRFVPTLSLSVVKCAVNTRQSRDRFHVHVILKFKGISELVGLAITS